MLGLNYPESVAFRTVVVRGYAAFVVYETCILIYIHTPSDFYPVWEVKSPRLWTFISQVMKSERERTWYFQFTADYNNGSQTGSRDSSIGITLGINTKVN